MLHQWSCCEWITPQYTSININTHQYTVSCHGYRTMKKVCVCFRTRWWTLSVATTWETDQTWAHFCSWGLNFLLGQVSVDVFFNVLLTFFKRCVQRDWSNSIYTKGCIAALEDWLPGNLYTVAIVFIVISLLQVQIPWTEPVLQYCRIAATVLQQKWSTCCMCSVFQMVGIYLARTLISDIEKVKFSYWGSTPWWVWSVPQRAEPPPGVSGQFLQSDVPSPPSSVSAFTSCRQAPPLTLLLWLLLNVPRPPTRPLLLLFLMSASCSAPPGVSLLQLPVNV